MVRVKCLKLNKFIWEILLNKIEKHTILYILLAVTLCILTVSCFIAYRVISSEERSIESNMGPKIIATRNTGKVGTISVRGEGVVEAKPNTVKIIFAVETKDKSALGAQKENSRIISRIVEKLKEEGISEEYLKTIGYKLYPVYRYDKITGRRILEGYTCLHKIEVTWNKIDEAGRIIDLVVSLGANRIEYVVFTLDDTSIRELREKALRKAIQDAEEKVKIITSELNLKDVKPTQISITYMLPPPIPVPVKALARTTETTRIIPPSELEIRVVVYITYQYKVS